MEFPKLVVTGLARHGKDTVCELLKESGFRFVSSSAYCAEQLVFPRLKEKYGYETPEECYEDRANHRKEWYAIISGYNEGDPARLSREIFTTNDIYCGLRNREELEAARAAGLVDCVLWVEANQRVGETETRESITITPADCDKVVSNNGTVEELRAAVQALNLRRK